MMSTSTVNRVESSRRFVKNVFLPARISATVRYVSTSTRAIVTVIIVALIFMFPMMWKSARMPNVAARKRRGSHSAAFSASCV